MGIICSEPKKPQEKANEAIDEFVNDATNDGSFESLKEIVAYIFAPPLKNNKYIAKHRKYIKCEYCESEIEDIFFNCPNCGAPLKRR